MGRTERAFTLVEILIVVLILAILAGIVVPHLSGSPNQAREAALLENAAKIRMVIELYRNQHAGLPDGDRLAEQLTCPTTFTGEVGEAREGEYVFGPYLEQMPPNPFSGLRGVRTTLDPRELFPPGDLLGGWWYNQATGRFHADLPDSLTDAEGTPYNRY